MLAMHTIFDFVKKGYFAYFKVKFSDQDMSWASYWLYKPLDQEKTDI